MSYDDGHWLEDMTFLRLGPDTGILAARRITAQARRDAAARAEVARELAANGADPYRDSGASGKLRPVRYDRLVIAPVVHKVAPPEPVLTPEQEIRAEILRPLGLDYGQLAAAFPDQPPDACGSCRTGPLFAGFRCWYCHALDEMAARQALPGTRREHAVNARALLAVLAALAVFWTVIAMIATGALG